MARFVPGNKFSCIRINYLLFILLPLYNLSRGDGVDAGGSGRRRAGCHCGVLSCGVLIGVPETTTPVWSWWGSPWAGGVGQKPSEKSDVGEGEEELQSFDCAETLLTWERFPTLKRSALDGGNHNTRPGRCRVVGGCAVVKPSVAVGAQHQSSQTRRKIKQFLVFMKNACDSPATSNEKPPAVQSST